MCGPHTFMAYTSEDYNPSLIPAAEVLLLLATTLPFQFLSYEVTLLKRATL